MAERSTLFQGVQVGLEGTYGTAVAANKKLTALSLSPSANINVNSFRAMGNKLPSLSAISKEWSTGSVEGQPTYTEMVYPFSSVISAATITTPSGGTTSRDWTFNLLTSSADSPVSFTVEQGDTVVRAHRVPGVRINGLNIDFASSRENLSMSGDMIGKNLEDAITMTSSPTSVALIPVLPKQVSFYSDSAAAGLGTTKLTRVLSASLSIANRYQPVWVYNSAVSSFVELVEAEPTIEAKLMVEADSQGMGLYAQAIASTPRFIRMEAIGAVIEAAITYKARWDACVTWTDVGEFHDEDGLYAIEFTGTVHHDSTWTRGLQAVVTNTLTAL